MDFQKRMEDLKESIESKLSDEQIQIMHHATDALRQTGIEQKVLGVSEEFPHFELENQNEMLVRSQDLLSKGPIAITFYRGFWCPYCNLDLSNLNKYHNEIKQEGGQLICISPELPEYSRKIIEKQHLGFEILHDPENHLANRLGLKFQLPEDLRKLYLEAFSIDLPKYHGEDSWTLPMPARFVINQQGIVLYSEASADYTQRPDPKVMLPYIRKAFEDRRVA